MQSEPVTWLGPTPTLPTEAKVQFCLENVGPIFNHNWKNRTMIKFS
jgi:hypothetical protein